MARIRSIHPGLFTDDVFALLSSDAQIFFVGLLTECDDYGAFEWNPGKLRLRLRGAKDGDTAPILEELRASNRIMRYEHGGRKLGLVRNFTRFQRPKKPTSTYFIPAEFRAYIGLTASSSEPDSNEAAPVRNRELNNVPQFRTNAASTQHSSEKTGNEQASSGSGSEPVPHQYGTQRPSIGSSSEIGSQMEDGGGRRRKEESSATTDKNPARDIVTNLGGEAVAAVVAGFRRLRDKHWPDHPNFPSPDSTLKAQAAQHLTAGASVELCIEVFDREMRRKLDRGEEPPTNLGFCRLTLQRETQTSRRGIQDRPPASPHGNGRDAGWEPPPRDPAYVVIARAWDRGNARANGILMPRLEDYPGPGSDAWEAVCGRWQRAGCPAPMPRLADLGGAAP